MTWTVAITSVSRRRQNWNSSLNHRYRLSTVKPWRWVWIWIWLYLLFLFCDLNGHNIKARLNGFNIWPTSVQQKLNGCLGQMLDTKTKLCRGPFKRFQHCANDRRHIDFCGLMWVVCILQLLNRSVQTASTPSNIFENKGKVESMLNESLNRFKLDSTRFQQAFNIFYAFNSVGPPVQTHPTFGSTKCWTHVEANVETV